MSEGHPTMPPVRLRPDAELAREALAAPSLARAVRLARWAAPGTPVTEGGALSAERARAAGEHLRLVGEDGEPDATAEAWWLALETGLLEIAVADGGDTDASATDRGAATAAPPAPVGAAGDDAARGDQAAEVAAPGGPGWIAGPGAELSALTDGSPQRVLETWSGLLDTVFDAVVASSLTTGPGAEDAAPPEAADPRAEIDFLDGVLANLYLLTALAEEAADRVVPLPALAASVIVPEDMEEPTDAVLEEVSEAMMRLDAHFHTLAQAGLVVYQPVDETLIEELDGEERPPETGGGLDEEDVSRYGLVRLTSLGVFGMRRRLLSGGAVAPAVGDLADQDASTLLTALPEHPETAAWEEGKLWLAGRDPLDAARDLLSAARGDDTTAPLRRLSCQQTLSLLGSEAEVALREVLEDRHLGGLARVWLAERGITGVPEPSEEMVFWLTVDTIAAQLAAEGDSDELRDLVRELADRTSGFFDSVWQVEHPATAEVLEAMGRLHPDRSSAKAARKAAFKARSRV